MSKQMPTGRDVVYRRLLLDETGAHSHRYEVPLLPHVVAEHAGAVGGHLVPMLPQPANQYLVTGGGQYGHVVVAHLHPVMHRDGSHRLSSRRRRSRLAVCHHALHAAGGMRRRVGDVGLHQRSGLGDHLVDELRAGHEHIIPARPGRHGDHPGELRRGALVGGLQQQGLPPLWERNHDAFLLGGGHAGAALDAVEHLEGHEAAVGPCGGYGQ